MRQLSVTWGTRTSEPLFSGDSRSEIIALVDYIVDCVLQRGAELYLFFFSFFFFFFTFPFLIN
jgi:hypothetical protein